MDKLTTTTESSYEMGKRLFSEGVREFCAGGFFEAHDLWEEFWQELRGPDRVFVQALIHLAVGTYHHENGNMNGARSQLTKAVTKLSKYPAGHWGVGTSEWLRWAEDVLAGRERAKPASGLPFDSSRFPSQIPMAPR
jgi:predicted metal-dependent hydrolase